MDEHLKICLEDLKLKEGKSVQLRFETNPPSLFDQMYKITRMEDV